MLVVAIGVALYLNFTKSSIEKDFDPTQQGRQARAAVQIGATWSSVVSAAGAPRKWKAEPSSFDFVTGYEDWNDATPGTITKKLENGEMTGGFCFLYRFSDAATFAVNFSSKGEALNIQDKESKSDLQDG